MQSRVVVIGGGFGGMAAIRSLHGADADIILVDRSNHFLFQPLLYQVAAAALSPADIATASRSLTRLDASVTVLMADVVGIDCNERIVTLAGAPALNYDYLIVAAGARYSFFGHNEWEQHVEVLKSLRNALAIRERILGAFERAEQCGDPDLIATLLTFVVVGGGPTGVELAGTIAELAKSTLVRDFKHIAPQSANVILCEAGDRVLAAFPKRLSDYARKTLDSLGVELRLGAAVTHIDGEGLHIGESFISSRCVLWCAGTEAQPAAAWLKAEVAKNGTIKVEQDCSVPGRSEVFVIGDMAHFDNGSGRPLPGLAPVAKQQGAYVGRLIKRRLSGKSTGRPFRYRNYGTMAVIGRSRAIADFGRFTLTGFPAWLTWSLVHLMLLIDFRSRAIVFVNWCWAWFTYGRGSRLLIGGSEATDIGKPGRNAQGNR